MLIGTVVNTVFVSGNHFRTKEIPREIGVGGMVLTILCLNIKLIIKVLYMVHMTFKGCEIDGDIISVCCGLFKYILKYLMRHWKTLGAHKKDRTGQNMTVTRREFILLKEENTFSITTDIDLPKCCCT